MIRAAREQFVRRRMWLFLLWCAAIVGVAVLLNAIEFDSGNDAKILFGFSLIIFVSIFIMIIETIPWTIRKLGVLGLISVGALLYGTIGLDDLWSGYQISQRDLNVMRAVIFVSAPMLALTQIAHIADWIRGWRRKRRTRNGATP